MHIASSEYGRIQAAASAIEDGDGYTITADQRRRLERIVAAGVGGVTVDLVRDGWVAGTDEEMAYENRCTVVHEAKLVLKFAAVVG